MNASRTLWEICLMAGIWTLLALAPGAQQVAWKSARSKLVSTDGYSVKCHYKGPEGSYEFNYVVESDEGKILTEVLEGSSRGAGSKILYDPVNDKENVKLKTDMFSLRRSTEARDIKDSMLYQPLFQQLVTHLVEPQPRETKQVGDHTLLFFGDKTTIQDILEVDKDGDPVNVRRVEKGKEVKRMTFSELSWGDSLIQWP